MTPERLEALRRLGIAEEVFDLGRRIGGVERQEHAAGPDHAEDLAELRQLSLACVIHHPDQVALLEQAPAGPPLHCWLKIDTGMHRLGIAPEDVHAIHARLSACAAVHPELVFMTHFASSDEFANPQTRQQLAAFAAATEGLWWARSEEFMQQPLLQNLRWVRTFGDLVFIGGALAFSLQVVLGVFGSRHSPALPVGAAGATAR